MSQLLSPSASTLTELIALNGTFVFQACLLSEAQEFAMHFAVYLVKLGTKMPHAILVFMSAWKNGMRIFSWSILFNGM